MQKWPLILQKLSYDLKNKGINCKMYQYILNFKRGEDTMNKRVIITMICTGILLTGLYFYVENEKMFAFSEQTEEEQVHVPKATVIEEVVSKRTKFTKDFLMSDGSHLGAVYSMPVNYMKNKVWKEVDTTLIKKGKYYQAKQTDLSIKFLKKTSKKDKTVNLKRGNYKLSFSLNSNKKVSAKTSKINKKEVTDVMNESKVKYAKLAKNTSVVYEVYPEKITEVITVNNKKAKKDFSYQYKVKGLKMKLGKDNRISFKTKKGKIKFARMKTIITDAAGVTTQKVKITYNKKKGIVTVKPDKKWVNSKKRKYPLQYRTATVTSEHGKDVKVASSYSGADTASYIYDHELIIKPSKGDAFIKAETLPELKNPKVKILEAALHIDNTAKISRGATKTFDIDVHEVTGDWNAKKVSYKNRPVFSSEATSVISLSKSGRYHSDITNLVKGWYQGKENYGVALIAGNANGTYEAKVSKNPYVTIRYEVPSFEGAMPLVENEAASRTMEANEQENYFSFKPGKDIAYEISTLGAVDTRITLYDANKKRIAYDDNSAGGVNAKIIRGFKESEGTIYVKVTAAKGSRGAYQLLLKKRYEIPVVTGERKADHYHLSWNTVANATEYVVRIYDVTGKIKEEIVKEPKYNYVFTNETVVKTLRFTVMPRENEDLFGENSRMIYTRSADSDWEFMEPISENVSDVATVSSKDKIYLLGGENEAFLYVYDDKKNKWEMISKYPEADVKDGFSMVYNEKDIYVFGGEKSDATISNHAYVYHTDKNQWEKLADMPQERSGAPIACLNDKIYLFAKCGAKNEMVIYDCKEGSYEKKLTPGTSDILSVCTMDDTIFALREKGSGESTSSKLFVSEYNEKDGTMEEDYDEILMMDAADYTSLTGTNGKLYAVSEKDTKDVLTFDTYKNEWNNLSKMNLKKSDAGYVILNDVLYSVGGMMEGFGSLDVVEAIDLQLVENTETLNVKKGEAYEIGLNAANLLKEKEYTVTVKINPSQLAYDEKSSLFDLEENKEGISGVKLVKLKAQKGIAVFRISGDLEAKESEMLCQSIPVIALVDGDVTVSMKVVAK